MNFKAIFLTVCLLLVSIQSMAFEAGVSYRIMGKGIQKRHTGETLALVCVEGGEICTKVQFALFHEDQSIERIGPVILSPTAPTSELAEKALQLQMEEYFATNYHSEDLSEKFDRTGKNAFFGAMAVSSIYGATHALPGGGISVGTAVIMGVPLLSVVLLFAYPGASLERVLVSDGQEKTMSVTLDRLGWNWSHQPKKINAKKFDLMVARIRSNANCINYSSRIYQHILKKMEKLKAQGVEFIENRRAKATLISF